MMKIKILFVSLIVFVNLFIGCRSRESGCVFIENHSRKIKIADLDSSCSLANKIGINAIPLFTYIDDSMPPDQLTKFYHFRRLRRESVDKHAVLFINNRYEFTTIYSDNMKGDSLLIKRYKFGGFVYNELKHRDAGLRLAAIYKEFNDLFTP